MGKAIRATAGTGVAGLLLATAACGGGTATPVERHLVYVHASAPAAPSVWIGDVNGAHSRRLTSGSVGVLSPDGRTVAVARRGEGVYLVSSDGKRERRLSTRQLRPRAWSPDGETLVATAATSQAVVELVAVDRRSGRLRPIARGSLYGFDFSPDGDELVYSRAPQATVAGICGDQFDLYVAKLDGGTPTRLTHDGLSAFPIWGSAGIALSHFPAGGSLADCSAPGIWTIKSDGSDLRPVIARAPDSITLAGYYGYQPLAWLDDDRLLIGLRAESGTEGAVLDTQTHKLRALGDYADEASSDGRFAVGSGGEEEVNVSILRLRDGHRVFRRKDSCCPDWNR
jgi:dipeptidyl aminopeptidase/acylaminoacyl peptidase